MRSKIKPKWPRPKRRIFLCGANHLGLGEIQDAKVTKVSFLNVGSEKSKMQKVKNAKNQASKGFSRHRQNQQNRAMPQTARNSNKSARIWPEGKSHQTSMKNVAGVGI